ncbi:MAG: amidohydrolase [Candidatus Aenigmarchaeota archaeon]|nr:amidohydrolase [Candidatus Aenigmarchaeota archaeon]
MKPNSVLIKNAGWIVTQNSKREILSNKSIYIEGNRIVEVGNPKSEADFILEADHKIVLPGLMNCHTHSPMTLLRGYSDDKSLEEWWFKDIYPVESKFKSKHIYYGSLLACIEMIKFGCTYFADFYYFLDQIAKAVNEAGIRCNLGQGILDVETFEFPSKKIAFLIAKRMVRKWRKKGRIKASIAPHMFQTTSPETYEECAEIVRKYNVLLQTHVCESKKEVEFALKNYEKRPVDLLEECGCLSDKTIAVHCNWVSGDDIKKFSKYDVKVVHCPVSNMKLGEGKIMPLKDMIRQNLTIGLGTDGCASNNSLDLFEEMKTCSLLHKSHLNDPTAMPAQKMLDLVTVDAAKVLHEEDLGSIEEGNKADLILIDTRKPHLQPIHRKHTVLSNLVYSAKGQDVSDVICDGKLLMEDGRITTLNEEEVYEKVRRILLELFR